MSTASHEVTRSFVLSVAVAAIAISTLVSGAPCASSPTVPTRCNDASSCIAGGDVCNSCAANSWLANAGTGACDVCQDEASAADARVSGTTLCAQDNAAFFYNDCSPAGASSDASFVACNDACSACSSTTNDKATGCTTCAEGYFDTNGPLRDDGICEVIKSHNHGSVLGMAEKFAVLGSAGVTNAGPSVITGNLGVSPGVSITGIPPGTVVGVVHATDPAASVAQADASIAFGELAGRAADPALILVV